MKLVKGFREELPGCVGPSWECRDCMVRDGAIWVLDAEKRLGRALTDDERTKMRKEIKSSMEQQLASSPEATDGDQSVPVELTARELDEIRLQVKLHMPAKGWC